MSRTELERLARIRMQVTGETLERAMAVLEGQTTDPGPQSGSDTKPDPTENGEVNGAGTDSESGEGNGGGENAAMPDGRRTPQRRNHLRGL